MDWLADADVHFLNWVVVEDEKLCVQCKNMKGKVYERHNLVYPLPPLHPHCRCTIQPIQTAQAGTATSEKHNGADWWLKNNGKLPDYYITYKEGTSIKLLPVRRLREGSTSIKTGIFLRNPVEYGMKQILIIREDIETTKESFIPVMDWFL